MGMFLLVVIQGVLQLLIWVIIASAIMSWLILFNVVNGRNPTVRQIDRILDSITRPLLWPLRRVIPPLGMVDITPIIAILILSAARTFLVPWLLTPMIAALGG